LAALGTSVLLLYVTHVGGIGVDMNKERRFNEDTRLNVGKEA
jgi:hypothetical protein